MFATEPRRSEPNLLARGEPSIEIDRGPRRQVVREQPPRHTTPQHVKDRVEDLTKRPGPRSPTHLRLGHERLNESPFGIGQVGFIAQVIAAMLPPGGWGPHRGSKAGFDNPSESRHPRPLNPFRSGLSARKKPRGGSRLTQSDAVAGRRRRASGHPLII